MKVAALMLAVAIAIHLYIFNNLPLQFDELLMHEVITRFHLWDMIPYLYIEEVQQPLGYLFVKFFMGFGETTFVMRLSSIIFLLLTPWVLYKLARLSMSKEDSLKASALLLFFYPVFMYSGSMRPYIPYICFSIMAFYQFLKPDKKLWALILSFLGLFLIHPLGSLIVFILTSVLLLRRKEGINLFLGMTSIGVILLTVAILYRQQEISELLVKFSFEEYFNAIYNFSFLISGREFFTFVVVLLLCLGYQKFQKREVSFKIDKFWLQTFGWSVAVSVLLMIFFGDHIYPRHFIYLLPGLAIITIQLINAVTAKEWARNSLFILAALILTYKSVFKQRLDSKPFEIDSASIASEAVRLSQKYDPVVSCGNCFRYYIKEKNLLCTGSNLPVNYFYGFSDAVYIEMDFVKHSCGLDKITQKYEIVESHKFIGGTVHKLKFPETNQ